MKKSILFLTIAFVLLSVSGYPWSFDWLKNQVGAASSTKLSDTKIGSGLKEALKVGIENTIKLLGKQDGYLGNEAVKILLPQTIKNLEPTLRKIGLGPKIDEFTLSMNRAAEKAAPLSADIFSSAITGMSFDDAQKILNGGNTAATDYLKNTTYSKLLEAFQPSVTKTMNDYAVTKKYGEIVDKAQTLPFAKQLTSNFDISKYVSSKALDGLFKVLSEQETAIRTNPSARVNDLLKQVFGK